MANDINNTSAGITGTQTIGQLSVLTGGRGSNLRKTYNPANVETSAVGSINDKYDKKLDEIRYYTGDVDA